MKKALGLILLLLIGITGWSLFQPYAGFNGGVFVEIPKGTGLSSTARMLAQAGVIRFNWQFVLVRALNLHRKVQAGEYQFRKAASAWEVFGRLARGETFYYDLSIPEGQTMFDIADKIESLGLMSRENFLTSARDPSSIRDLAPEATSLEGYLFPSTYRLTRHMTAEQICALMTGQFRRQWRGLNAEGNVHKLVTMASVVEKETARPDERNLVASVYWNRLREGMRLEADPTTIYAALLDGRYRGRIYRSDLESNHPYNTYRHAGLPPGPIANPGLQSLKAALAPAETNYLYFVAQPGHTGASTFSTTLAAHQRAVAEYRHAKKQERSTQTMASKRAAAANH
jgi:UPF0755 protein